MPNYDFGCRDCGVEFEKNVPMNERDRVTHDCGGEAYRKITFFGSVWAPTAGGTR